MINWKVRIKNLNFWIAFIPAVLLLVTTVCDIFGIKLNLEGLSEQLLTAVKALFSVLVILGIVNDPTTTGLGDSDRALTYTKPWKDEEE